MLERSAARPMNHETNTQICRFLGLLDNNRRAKLRIFPNAANIRPDFLQINGDLGISEDSREFQRIPENFRGF